MRLLFDQLQPSLRILSVYNKWLRTSIGAHISVRVHKLLGTTQGLIREGIVEHTTLPRVGLNVGHIPNVRDLAVVRPRPVVRLCLDHVTLRPEDRLVRRRRVHDHGIWAVSEDRSCPSSALANTSSKLVGVHTILLLKLQQPDVSVLFSSVQPGWYIRYLGPERARVFGERMQVQSVKDHVQHVCQTQHNGRGYDERILHRVQCVLDRHIGFRRDQCTY